MNKRKLPYVGTSTTRNSQTKQPHDQPTTHLAVGLSLIHQRRPEHVSIGRARIRAVRRVLPQVLAFLVTENADWPESAKEEHRIGRAIRSGKSTPERLAELLTEVQRNVQRLGEFKAWLNGRGITCRFSSPDELRAHVTNALHDWRKNQSRFAPPSSEAGSAQPDRYQRKLLDRTAHIDIRGLATGESRAHRFQIDSLHITLRARRREAASRIGSSLSFGLYGLR